MWTDEYINIRYLKDGRSRSGADCWGLVKLVYQERLNIILTDYAGILKDQSVESLREIARIMKIEREKWIRIIKPQLYDLVLLRAGLFHIGLVTGKNEMLHTDKGIESTIEPLNGIQWKNRIEGYYRYAG